ncbi:MAG TPA: exosortase/archaeosortase family protein [Chthonomonadales bacterium]|nr:exosortase/archaeosortase family protein [Chthonomonadales bacterium]
MAEPSSARGLLPRIVAWAFLLGTAAAFAPAMATAAQLWLTRDSYAHGMFVVPTALVLLWTERRHLREAAWEPRAWGWALVASGVALYIAAMLSPQRALALWAIVPVLTGGAIALHGLALWRIVRFPLLLCAFAFPLPNGVLEAVHPALAGVSGVSATVIVDALGYTVILIGDRLEVPGEVVIVADGCSGYKKTISLIAFAAIYGWVFRSEPWRRALLLAGAAVIAVFANTLRIASLVIVLSEGGMAAYTATHDHAARAAVLVAFVIFIGYGKALGCRGIRFFGEPSPPAARPRADEPAPA